MNINRRNSIVNTDDSSIIASAPYYPSAPEVEKVELRRVWDVICRRWPIMVATIIVVLAIGAVYTLRQKPMYESEALMIVASSRSVSYSSDETGILNDLAALTRSKSVSSVMAILSSPNVINAAANRLGEDTLIRGFGDRTIPEWALNLDSKKESDVISVSVKAYDPQIAADLANALVSASMEREQGFNSMSARQGKESVSAEMESVQKQLTQSQKELSDYKRKTKLVVADSQLQQIAGNMQSLQIEQDKVAVDLAAAQRQKETIRSQISQQGNEVEASSTIQMSPEYQAALSTLGSLNAQRATLIQEYTPQSSEVKKVDGAIAETKQHMKQIASTMVASKVNSRNPFLDSYVNSIVDGASIQARKNALGKVVAQRNRQIESLPEQERAMTKLMQRVSILDRTYQMLSSNYYSLLINEKSTMPSARVASSALPVPKPIAPNKQRNVALFFLLGLMLSVAMAAVAERMDGRVRDEETVNQFIGDTALAIIPNEKRLKTPGSQIELNSPFVEAFRILQNVIFFGQPDNDIKLLAITSPGRGEGKSTTSVYLAGAMAKSGKKVLLVDCDLRRPSLRKALDIRTDIGLTNFAKGLVSAEDAILSTKCNNVSYLATGPLPEDPAEFLNDPETRNALKSLGDMYDIVILDCPPCAGLGDVQIISTIAQGLLLVVTMNQTLKPSLYRTIHSLNQVGAPVIGYVINRLNPKRSGYDYYDNYDYKLDSKPKRWGRNAGK